MQRIISLALLFISLIGACANSQQSETSGAPSEAPVSSPSSVSMNSYVAIFEIAATDIERAVGFYQAILDIEIEQMEFPGMKMGLLPIENQANVGVIMQGEGYVPSAEGVTIYLNAGDDLQLVLDRVELHGGQIIMPKTPHADEVGFFALFLDSEGNRLGLHSPN